MTISDDIAGQIFGEKIAIIGYGSQGHAHALNLRDSGASVSIGLRSPQSPSWIRALSDGWQPVVVGDACDRASTIMMCTPDTISPAVYRESVESHMKKGVNLMFCHGYNIHFGHIQPPPEVDVTMVAPSGPGQSLRHLYTQNFGLPCLVAIHQDASGIAGIRAHSYAHALGCTRAKVFESTFAEETETDLFGEQAVLCGGLMGLVRAGYETLVDAGYNPEVAYFECVHQVKLLAELIQQGGLSYMLHAISDTAEWGAYGAARRVIGDESRSGMQAILENVRNGEFDRNWQLETEGGMTGMRASYREVRASELETVGKELRASMPFLPPKEVPEEE